MRAGEGAAGLPPGDASPPNACCCTGDPFSSAVWAAAARCWAAAASCPDAGLWEGLGSALAPAACCFFTLRRACENQICIQRTTSSGV